MKKMENQMVINHHGSTLHLISSLFSHGMRCLCRPKINASTQPAALTLGCEASVVLLARVFGRGRPELTGRLQVERLDVLLRCPSQFLVHVRSVLLTNEM
jgi:hypothetical protein